MPDRIAASGTVHWLGTGLSTGSGLSVVCEQTGDVVLWGRTADKAAACADRLGLTGRVLLRALDLADLAEALNPGDILVSMLPATEHAALLRLCIDREAHFACTSYTSEELAVQADIARDAGVVVLTEAGLDPGLDHVMTHALVARAIAAVGTGPVTADYTSYCGGLPAIPNDFRYRFSWAPRGVLGALCSPARYLDGGSPITVTHPWEATRTHTLGGEDFDAYPNRDSLPFLGQYAFPPGWQARTFVRGTLRLSGWLHAWAPVFDVLRDGDANRIDRLAADLAARYPTTSADADRVVLAVALTVAADDGPRWHGEYLLDLVGTATENAMARCVSVPLALGIADILDGTTPAGLHRGVEDAAEAERWIERLPAYGIECRFKS